MSSMKETSREEESKTFECVLSTNLLSDTPVVGFEFNPRIRVRTAQWDRRWLPDHTVRCTWHRSVKNCGEHMGHDIRLTSSSEKVQALCYVHPDKLATVQCEYCLKLNLPVEKSYYCSHSCFSTDWKRHKVTHQHASEEVNSDTKKCGRELRNCSSWEAMPSLQQEEKEWIEVGSSQSYVPTSDDLGSILRLVSVAVDPVTGAQLTAMNIIETKPVITGPVSQPRNMINLIANDPNIVLKSHSSDGMTFSVLSYNVLADIYIRLSGQTYNYCPSWALVWEYRRQKLLDEIIGYDADILCLQEVQSDHFEDFFKPELTKCGYSAMSKQKMISGLWGDKGNDITEGCAIFYRSNLFREVSKIELEYSKLAEAVNREAGCHLGRGNIALIAILQFRAYATCDFLQSIIFVANTHISANPALQDVKLFQIGELVSYLRNKTNCRIPVLICGDFNSLPLSDPHRLVVCGGCNPAYNEERDPFRVTKHIKLSHPMKLASAYSSFSVPHGSEELRKKMNIETKEPLFTNMTQNFTGTLDYIFYTENTLKVEGLLDLLKPESLRPGIPSTTWPSDHIALMARFRVLKRPNHSRTSVIVSPPHSRHDAKKQNQHSYLKSLRKPR